MTLDQIKAILNSTNETPEGKQILLLQLASGVLNTHANAVFEGAAALDKPTLQKLADTMQVDAGHMLAAAKAAATAPSNPVIS